jgi:hypothetical protein
MTHGYYSINSLLYVVSRNVQFPIPAPQLDLDGFAMLTGLETRPMKYPNSEGIV